MGFSILSIKALCEIAGISRITLFREIAAGRLIALKCRRRTIIRAQDFIAWLDKEGPKSGSKYHILGIDPEVTRTLCKGLGSKYQRAFYTIPEISELTTMSCESIRREIKDGHLKTTVFGKNRVLVSNSDLMAWYKKLVTKKAG